jgi:hypothetical protein
MATTTRGLSPTDIGAIRDNLAAGRRPKVVFTDSAGQIAGQVGQVVELTDPAGSDEWIVVRFGRDELPFSPADLATPTRAASAKRTGAKSTPANPANGSGTGSPAAGPPLKLAEPPRRPLEATDARGAATANGTKPTNGSQLTVTNGQQLNGHGPTDESTTAIARPAKAAKAKVPASLTVTLAYAEREWTVAASLGAKTLAKPYLIKPTDALRMVALVDVPGVHEAVENIIEAERAEAEGRAAKLRTELAEIESRLAELSGTA